MTFKEKIDKYSHRIWLSKKYIAKTAAEWTATLYALAGLISVFVSFEGVFPDTTTLLKKILVSIAILAGVWVCCVIICSIRVCVQKKKKVVDGRNGKAVYVVYGDLFDPEIVNGQKRYIAFAANRCFDTIVDDNLVGANTIHGRAFNRLYDQKLYTPGSLNEALQQSIKGNPKSVLVSREGKKEGNLKRYEVGAYANLKIDDKLNYLPIGLSWFDENLNAQTSLQEYVLAVQKMIEAFDKESQGYPVLMPIIGTGRSRTDLNEREVLEYLIAAFKINQVKITSDIYIVVYESDENRIFIADL